MPMEVIVAKTAGFCFGVKRAMELAEQQIREGVKPIYTLGPIIHNDQVVSDLKRRGVSPLTMDELGQIHEGTVIIRSHGVGPQVYEQLRQQGVQVADATCPFVKKIHNIVRQQHEAGRRVVIIGDRSHPEVEGIRSWCSEDALIIGSEADLALLPQNKNEKLCIVSQTTFNYKNFKELVEKITKRGYDITVLNTICSATEERQREAEHIASQVDAMVVIGGKNSSNTRKLYEICQRKCKNTHFIQTLDDLSPESVNSVRSVGITAGASTPNNIIEEVQKNVGKDF